MPTTTDAPADAGIGDASKSWGRSCPALSGEFDRDAHAFAAFWREGADLRARHRSDLARVRAAGGDRARLTGLLARFGRTVAADRTVAAKLEARWSDAVGRSWAQQRARFALALKADALELGSLACARYFDPLTYG